MASDYFQDRQKNFTEADTAPGDDFDADGPMTVDEVEKPAPGVLAQAQKFVDLLK